MSTFICTHEAFDLTPRCCSCPTTAMCRDEDGETECPDTCEFCTDGCAHAPLVDDFGEVLDDDGCCMYLEPPPEESPLHPSQMPIGWPRPTLGGLPHPYIAESDNLGKVQKHRRLLCVADRRCQVCGEPLGEWSVGCWRPGDAIIMDGAAVCLRCWPTALRLCPAIGELARAGRLLSACVRTESWAELGAGLTAQIMGMGSGYAVPTL